MPDHSINRKIEHYCAYQERSQFEVRQKLTEMRIWGEEAEAMIVKLIEENFVNEERFALAYASGKFRIRYWGRNKIKQGLQLKRVSSKLITKALNSIDEEEYLKTLQSIIEKKAALLTERDPYKRKYKLTQYALGKGFEGDIINSIFAQS